ncbi:MAG: hypothetical protein M3235_16890 [Actinomycetota bacterium]|nr:hypothetical protein [Actinomycetota bacterium]
MTVADGPDPTGPGSGRAGNRSGGRTARGRARPEPNRLHRRTERIEDALAWVLGVVTAAGVLVALVVGWSAHDGMADRARTEAGDREQTWAVLVESAIIVGGDTGSPTATVPVRWTGRDGQERTGRTEVDGGLPAGSTVPVWVGRDGDLVPAPVTSADAVAVAVLSGSAIALAWGAGCAVLGWVMFWCTARRFARSWEQEWERVEPEWSGRRPFRPET